MNQFPANKVEGVLLFNAVTKEPFFRIYKRNPISGDLFFDDYVIDTATDITIKIADPIGAFTFKETPSGKHLGFSEKALGKKHVP